MKNASKLSTEPYKGVRDFYPEQFAIQHHMFSVWRKVLQKYGYDEYTTSILEPSELYKSKTSDEIVNEQTYTFTDRGEREVTLRPEMTPSVARLVAARKRELGFPLRWFSIPNCFRYERPQKGRGREFWQLNCDIFGLSGVEAEIEMIRIAYDIMKEFGAKDSDFKIKISSRKLLNALFNEWYELSEDKAKALQQLIDRKAKMAENEFYANAEHIVGEAFSFLNFDEASEALAIPAIREAKEELDKAISTLKSLGIHNVEYDETLVRGFDYYTGIVFEVFDLDPENPRSLYGGGRYDNLLSLFGDEKVPAVGFGAGDMTMENFLQSRGLIPKYQATADIMVCIMEESAREYADEVASIERAAGKNVAVNYTYKSIGDQIKAANKLSIPNIIVIGTKEAEAKSYEVKKTSNE